ncbi:coiled-coil domain-containing protein 42 like-2-like [Musca vetustissima]|uniref:coiled-coil domain-containing protein 42 like-2-like n=1 Tax=Musca vetustissima TaxID=27455 RepID=UPI002AB7464A|nr:coiled-coil domain-containing protein 42 like-2-like [Musca vetustissima]
MPRLKPTTKVDVIGNLDLSPEKAVGDYIESKQQKAFFIKPPNWDSAGDSIELLYIRNEREHAAMMRLQEEMLENAKTQSAGNAARIRKLYKIHANLRKRFIEVNNFIKDCGDKKRMAEKKVAEETAMHEELKEQIAKYKTSIEELTHFRDVLKATVKEFEPYEKVLEEVVEKSDIFESVKDCMDRCDALMLAQVEISRLEQEKLQEIEEMRQRMVKLTNEAALTVLGLKNDLAELERSYNQARAECSKWEKIMANAKDTVATHDLNKDRALDGIHYMYRLLCKRRNMDPLYQRNEIEKQLDYIKDEIELLIEVNKECAKQQDKWKTSAATTTKSEKKSVKKSK